MRQKYEKTHELSDINVGNATEIGGMNDRFHSS